MLTAVGRQGQRWLVPIGRKSLDQAMRPGQHASANEKKKHINIEDRFGAVLQLADRAFVMIKKKIGTF